VRGECFDWTPRIAGGGRQLIYNANRFTIRDASLEYRVRSAPRAAAAMLALSAPFTPLCLHADYTQGEMTSRNLSSR